MFNLKLGFATNSSSTHSVIFLPGHTETDNLLCDHGQFGWEDFVLASPEAKASYAYTALQSMLRGVVDKGSATILTKAIASKDGMPRDFVDRIQNDDYIDHQSTPFLPYSPTKHSGHSNIWLEFFDDFRKFLLDDSVVVLGGNDNNDEGENSLHNVKNQFRFPSAESLHGKQFMCRKDGTNWIIFDRQTGNRLIIDFDAILKTKGRSEHLPLTKLNAPLLVDFKVTDRCYQECKFCYQGSTRNGKHADVQYVKTILYALKEMGVFEIAIGGGEPMQFPLEQVVDRYTTEDGPVLNVSSRQYCWNYDLLHNKLYGAVRGIGLSVGNEEEALDAAHQAISLEEHKEPSLAYPYYATPRYRISFHVVLGAITRQDWNGIYKVANRYGIPIVVLGWKTPAKKGCVKKDDTWFADIIKDLIAEGPRNYCRVSLDTCAIRRFKDLLGAIPDWLYFDQEGIASCYIDAVDRKMGPSSYCDPSLLVPLPARITSESLLDIWRKLG